MDELLNALRASNTAMQAASDKCQLSLLHGENWVRRETFDDLTERIVKNRELIARFSKEPLQPYVPLVVAPKAGG